ncbi:LuxR family transcriptional regulator, partial [Streptomyces sp. SID11233]|nr:LuxR family transcriptional regulator [Streptomyces sp. SID11233]
MTNERLRAALRLLGLGRPAADVYLALLDLAPAPLPAVGAAAGLAGPELDAAYGALVDAG